MYDVFDSRFLIAMRGLSLMVFYTTGIICVLLTGCKNRWVQIATFLVFLYWPGNIRQSASTMLEYPSMLLGLIAICCVWFGSTRGRRMWLIIGGFVFALGMNVKLSCIQMLVPILLILVYSAAATSRRWIGAESARNVALFGLASGTAFLIVYWALPQHVLLSSLYNHGRAGLSESQDGHPIVISLYRIIVCIVGLIGIWLGLSNKNILGSLSGIGLLAGAATIHAIVRPWWYYYEFHFTIPLSILFGVSLEILLKRCFQSDGVQLGRCKNVLRLSLLGATVALIFGLLFPAVVAEYEMLRESPGIAMDPRLETISRYQNKTHWVYSENQPLIHLARMDVPPEFVVMVLKRWWTAEMTEAKRVSLLEKYRPEQLILTRDGAQRYPPLREFLDRDYIKVGVWEGEEHYVANALNPIPIGNLWSNPLAADLLQQLGLTRD